MLGATSMVLESTIINVAIPSIMAHFGIGQDTAQWLSAGFLASMTATILTAAWCVQALGPAVGGYLVDVLSWRAIFFVTMPFCLAALYLVPRFMPERAPGATRPRFDWLGLILLTTFVFTALDSFHSGHRDGWGSTAFLWRAIVALAVGGGFILWERSTPQRMLELRLFREPGFAAASVVSVAYGIGLYGSTYVVPLFTQTIARYGAAKSGVLLLPGGLVLAATILVAGRLSNRLSSHYVITSGLACFSTSFLLFATGDATTAFASFALWIVIGRIGLGTMIPSLSAGAMQAIRPELLTQGTGAINFLRQFGGALGVNLLSLTLEWRSAVHATEVDGATRAFHDSFLALALIFLLAMVPAWMMRSTASGNSRSGFGGV